MNEVKIEARVAHLGWRLLAMTYDAIPLIAIVFILSALWLLASGGKPVVPGSWQSYAELIYLWAGCGAYAVLSWRRGGQTMGGRPWNLRVLTTDGKTPQFSALMIRYAVATFSLLLLGLGFVWMLFDAEQRTWHDIASRTQCYRLQHAAK